MTPTEALPADVLYSLLTALGPKKLAKAEPKPDKDGKVDQSARRDFEEVARAADKAKSAAEFAQLIDLQVAQEDTRSHGAIKSLIVINSGGDVIIQVIFEDGVVFQAFYPVGTI
jgi:hypothetical protein